MQPVNHDSITDVVSAQELATRLGVHERTVRRWISEGRLRAAKRGASFAIRLADAEALAGTSLQRKLASQAQAADQELELLLLRGRYEELKDRLATLEEQLAVERRNSARLELELEMRTAA